MQRTMAGVIGACVCAGALVVGATSVGAGTVKKAGTSLTAFANNTDFVVFGEVGSSKPKCVKDRKVVAFDSFGEKIGKDFADKSGAYEIDSSAAFADPVDGEVIARKKVFRNAKGNVNLVCKNKIRPIKDATTV